MKIFYITKTQLRDALATINREYAGNVIFNREPEKDGRAVSFTLRVSNSREPGARRSYTGRRIPSACWHVHRDLFTAILETNPQARIKTAVADYHGRADFLEKFPATGKANIGSNFEPLEFQDACDCE